MKGAVHPDRATQVAVAFDAGIWNRAAPHCVATCAEMPSCKRAESSTQLNSEMEFVYAAVVSQLRSGGGGRRPRSGSKKLRSGTRSKRVNMVQTIRQIGAEPP